MKNYSSHVGIVGGGISGLAVGCALELQGIKTIIFERGKGISEYGAGISISPNGLRLLEKLGTKEDFINESFSPKKVVMRHLDKDILTLEAEVLTAGRQNLIKVIHQRYLELGGEMLFNHECLSLNQETCELMFSNVETYKVSHILACDGIKSPIRQKYFSSSETPTYSGYSAWRGIGISDSKDLQFNFGPGSHLVSYPINDQESTSFVGIVRTKEANEDSWKTKGSKDQFLEDFKPYDYKTTAMLNSSEEIYKWGIYIRPPLKSMHSHNLTLLGDAAHPMVPFLGQGGCMAIEDSYTFGALMGRLKGDFKMAQLAYEKIRLERNNKIQSASRFQGQLNHIQSPTIALVRNLVMKHTPIVSMRTRKIWDYDADAAIEKFFN
jgi:salicylate hydroxylase